jgi:hypothetical protein
LPRDRTSPGGPTIGLREDSQSGKRTKKQNTDKQRTDKQKQGTDTQREGGSQKAKGKR